MRSERAITTFIAFGASILVGLLVALVFNYPAFAQVPTPSPIPGGFSLGSMGSLLVASLLLTSMSLVFSVILTAEIAVARAGHLKEALEIIVLLGALGLVLLLIVTNGPLIVVSFVVSLPFAAVFSSKIPVQTKKQKDRWVWS